MRIRVGLSAKARWETFEMSKVCTLDADCTVAQLRRMRVGIDTSDREALLVIGHCTKAERSRLVRSRLERSLLPTTSVLATNLEYLVEIPSVDDSKPRTMDSA
jgi:hypothetical protein